MATDRSQAKDAAGKAAAELVQDGMLIGLGTGSTATHFISHLIERVKKGLKISAVATSDRSATQAQAGGIPLADTDKITQLDLAVDGADQIDQQFRMIKGGGGALMREKVIATTAKEMVIIVDNSKVVNQLGTFPLAVALLPFAYNATIHKIQSIGLNGTLRLQENGTPYVTDNGNFIFDIHFPTPPDNPEEIDAKLHTIPGILETGFFFGIADKVIIGYPDGHTEIRA